MEYFEGESTYTISYRSKTEHFTNSQLEEKYGVYGKTIFKKGEYLSKIYGSSGNLISTNKLDLFNNKFYYKRADSDTVLWYDIRANDYPQEILSVKDTTIAKYECRKVKTSTKIENVVTGDIEENSNYFCYAKDYPINPNWYANFKESNFNEIIAQGKGYLVYSFKDVIYWEILEKVSSIQRREVKRSELLFELPDEKRMKEI